MASIHSKEKLDDYLGLIMEEKSLHKIKVALSINKKTAFDRRHKILASLSDTDKDNFTGITESDETFFLNSEKGRTIAHRVSRKRGGSSKARGISDDQVAVIVTQDRKSVLDLTVAAMGRLKKVIKVYQNGSMRWKSYYWIYLTAELKGKYVGGEDQGNGIWRVFYKDLFSGYFSENRIKDKQGSIRLSQNLV
ncbi:MAG: hypothetical protein ACJA1Z_004062 [Patiriisocius sp.]|jgi:hypothetical protein